MGPKTLKVDELLLDMNNPRVESSKSQPEEVQKLLSDQGEGILGLAEDILENGLSPIERLLVMQDKTDVNKYVVLEGNRRLLALRILTNPSLLGGIQVTPKLKTQFEEVASQFRQKQSATSVDCYVVDKIEDGRHWILLRHTGANDGAGVVDWTAFASARFRGENPALQALEFVMKFGALSAEEKTHVQRHDFPLTTLDRLLSSRAVRQRLGFDVKSNKLVSGLPPDELIKPLRRIVVDLGSKRIRVSRVMNTADQIRYVTKDFGPRDKPNLTKAGQPRTVEDIVEADFKKKPQAAKAKRKQGNSSERSTVAPRTPKLSISVDKIAEVYTELQRLKVDEFPHACSVLLRVFLELSADHYLSANSIPLEAKDAKGNKHNKDLGKKVNEAVDHLVRSGANKRDFAGVIRGLNVDHSPLSIHLLHQYVHNRFVTPSGRELKAGWNHASPLFERIWT
jgi:hypothetical protein